MMSLSFPRFRSPRHWHRSKLQCYGRFAPSVRLRGHLLLGVVLGGMSVGGPSKAQEPATPAPPPREAPATPPAPAVAFDPRALQLLSKMREAYARLTALDQATEYTSSATSMRPLPNGQPAPPAEEQKLDQSLRLQFQHPNRLRMELTTPNPSGPGSLTQRWVSDGKTFWTYLPEKNWYTREKAPRRMSEFQQMSYLNSGCLELLMLMGVDPFANLKESVDSLQYEGTATVREALTDVVTMHAGSRYERYQVKLYIGRSDQLLRRFLIEMEPVVESDSKGRVGDAFDELLNDTAPLSNQSDIPPLRARLTYDNILKTPTFDFRTFFFEVPPKALLYGEPKRHDKRNGQIQQILEEMKRLRKQKK